MTAPAPIDLVFLDGQALFREALAHYFSATGCFRVAATASSIEALIPALRGLNQAPGLCLLDAVLPDGGATDATRAIWEIWPGLKCAILTSLDHKLLIRKMCQAGMAGYLLKEASLRDLDASVRRLTEGEETGVFSHRAQKLWMGLNALSREQARGSYITPREEEFLTWCLHLHLSFEQIADHMHVCLGTVKGYISALNRKTGDSSRAGLADFARCYGLSPAKTG